MSRITRWIYWLALGLMHVSLAAAVVFLLGQIGDPSAQPRRWPEFGLVFVGALAVAASRSRSARRLAPLIGVGLVALGLKSLLGGGLSPLAGWADALDRDSFPAQEALLSGAAMLWLLSRGLAAPSWSVVEVAGFLRRGLIALLLGLTLGAAATQTNLNVEPTATLLTLYAACFVAGGLLALALEHSSSYSSDNEQRPSVGRTLSLVGGLIGLTLLLLAVFSSAGRTLLGYALGWLVDVGAVVVGVIAGVIYAVGVLLFPSIEGDVAPATPIPGTAAPSAAEQAAQLQQQLESLPAQQSPWFEMIAQGVAVLLAALAAWLVVRQALRSRQRLDKRADGDEQRSSVWSWDQFGADVRHLLQGLLPSRATTDPALEGGAAPARIRRAYRRMLRLGAESARPRQPEQTPAEYRAALDADLTDGAASREILTAAYEQARYGPPPDEGQAAAAERALGEIEGRLGEGKPFNAKAPRGKERKD